jgi:hypothetical protein
MRSKLLNVDPPVTYAVILQTGDEVMNALNQFLQKESVETASFTAIGAFSHAVIGYFDWQTKSYRKIKVDEQVEALSLIGDVAMADAKPVIHAHATLGKSEGSVIGGHLIEATVRPTLEIILVQPPSYLKKRKDPESGLLTIAID